MIGLVPVSDEDGVVAGRIGEGDRDSRAAEDSDAAETAGGLVESKRREVEEASDLVLHLGMLFRTHHLRMSSSSVESRSCFSVKVCILYFNQNQNL